jgi:hypothetical protein
MPFDGRDLEIHNPAVRKVDRAIDLLRNEDRWCKNRLRTTDGKRCLLAALLDARARRLSTSVLAAAKELTGKTYSRVESFNDDDATHHGLVLAVLRRAREDLLLTHATSPRSTGLFRRIARAFLSQHAFATLGAVFGVHGGGDAF